MILYIIGLSLILKACYPKEKTLYNYEYEQNKKTTQAYFFDYHFAVFTGSMHALTGKNDQGFRIQGMGY